MSYRHEEIPAHQIKVGDTVLVGDPLKLVKISKVHSVNGNVYLSEDSGNLRTDLIRCVSGQSKVRRIIHGTATPSEHSHYFKPCPYDQVDVYRVLQLFTVTDPCIQHAVKKLLCAGGRGPKDAAKDIQEAIDALERWKAMRAEEVTK